LGWAWCEIKQREKRDKFGLEKNSNQGFYQILIFRDSIDILKERKEID
jgi:hypothetical protein